MENLKRHQEKPYFESLTKLEEMAELKGLFRLITESCGWYVVKVLCTSLKFDEIELQKVKAVSLGKMWVHGYTIT